MTITNPRNSDRKTSPTELKKIPVGEVHPDWLVEWTRSRSNAGLGDAPSIEAAYAMGAKGGPVVEAERLAFEAWMRGHCWSVSDTWDGSQYADRASAKKCGWVDPLAMDTRRLWAVWRDRAALMPNPTFEAGEL